METKVNEKNLVDFIIDYESGQLDDKGILNLFSHLIKSGKAWSMQGSYGRASRLLIEQGFISEEGNIDESRIKT